MKKFKCGKCGNYFDRERLVVINGVGVCECCSNGSEGIRKKISKHTYRRAKNVVKQPTKPKAEIEELRVLEDIRDLLRRNGYIPTSFGAYKKLGNGATEVHYASNLQVLVNRLRWSGLEVV